MEDYLLSRLQHCDLVLIEGFEGGDFPKLEVWCADVGKPTLWPAWPGIVAVASDTRLPSRGHHPHRPGGHRVDR